VLVQTHGHRQGCGDGHSTCCPRPAEQRQCGMQAASLKAAGAGADRHLSHACTAGTLAAHSSSSSSGRHTSCAQQQQQQRHAHRGPHLVDVGVVDLVHKADGRRLVGVGLWQLHMHPPHAALVRACPAEAGGRVNQLQVRVEVNSSGGVRCVGSMAACRPLQLLSSQAAPQDANKATWSCNHV